MYMTGCTNWFSREENLGNEEGHGIGGGVGCNIILRTGFPAHALMGSGALTCIHLTVYLGFTRYGYSFVAPGPFVSDL